MARQSTTTGDPLYASLHAPHVMPPCRLNRLGGRFVPRLAICAATVVACPRRGGLRNDGSFWNLDNLDLHYMKAYRYSIIWINLDNLIWITSIGIAKLYD
jgi:hypothetical protein